MRSILSRYDAAAALDKRINELDPTGAGATLSPLHLRTVEVLTDLLSMADSVTDDDTPPMLRTMLAVVRRSRPMLLDLVGKVPEHAIVQTMTKLRDDIQSVLDTALASAGDRQAPKWPRPAACHYLESGRPCIYVERDGSCDHCGAQPGSPEHVDGVVDQAEAAEEGEDGAADQAG